MSALAALAVLASSQALPVIELKPGMIIQRSARVKPGVYRIPSAKEDGSDPAIRIRGTDIVLDMAGVTLEGTPQTVDPDKRRGTGIRIAGENITIKNARVRGYKVGLMARSVDGLRILDSDFSYNWEARLMSTPEREDLADWMSYHQNEKDEWLRYGAAIYLRECDGFEVRGTRVNGGQNGLMITESDHGLIWNNDFSFLSAVGLGMYRSSDNRIMHNTLDWCVRGYSHGVYNRGQDSTGILIYEQSHRNTFAYNSATHGGDGFFLWAGQSTMDTAQGGCNDNLLYGNDWSHSPANGIEATFSRNAFVNNLMLDSWHGVWGGYSYDTKILGNVFGMNGESIAIEHGQNNDIRYNVFDRDHLSLYLWQNASQDPNWGYPKFRDTRNVGTTVRHNVFRNATSTAIELGGGFAMNVDENLFQRNARPWRLRANANDPYWNVSFRGNAIVGTMEPNPTREGITWRSQTHATTGPESAAPLPEVMSRGGNANTTLDPLRADYLRRFAVAWNPWPNKGPITPKPVAAMLAQETWSARGKGAVTAVRLAEEELRQYAPAPLPGGKDPFLKAGALRGRRYILVDEWGPYDFKSPRLALRSNVDGLMTFEVLGPKGTAKLHIQEGLAVESISNDGRTWAKASGAGAVAPVPGMIRVRLKPGPTSLRKLQLTYVGEATTDYRGIVTPKGKPVDFGWSTSFIPIDWDVKWFTWKAEAEDPRTQADAFKHIIAGTPVKTQKTDRLDFPGNVPGVQPDYYITVATGSLEVPAGTYVIDMTTDDGARLWLDGKLIVEDAWKFQGPTLYSREVKLKGKHSLRVEHFEINGYSALKVAIRRKG